jgi:hypothetical protein
MDKNFFSSAKGTMMWRKLGCVVFCFLLSGCIYMGRDFSAAPGQDHPERRDDPEGNLRVLRETRS